MTSRCRNGVSERKTCGSGLVPEYFAWIARGRLSSALPCRQSSNCEGTSKDETIWGRKSSYMRRSFPQIGP